MSDRRGKDEAYARLEDIDREIVRHVERRARLVEDLIKHRTGNAALLPISDSAHKAALERAAHGTLPASSIRDIFDAIDAACRVYDVAPRVVYSGIEGGFGWIAARAQFGGRAELSASPTALSAFEEVSRSRADFAVVPYESREEGPAFEVIQAIVAADLKLVGEKNVTQALSLVARPGGDGATELGSLEAIHVVPLHRLACVGYLEQHHPRATVHDARSPQAALEAATLAPGAAAIVPRGTPLNGGEAKGLVVARENVADAGEARIRWGVVSRLPMPRSGSDATAMLFGVHDRPGALHDILLHFKERDCNLRRIHSRAVLGPTGWDHLFYAEVGGHVTDRPLTSALEGVKREARTLHVVGSFPLEEPVAPVSSPPR